MKRKNDDYLQNPYVNNEYQCYLCDHVPFLTQRALCGHMKVHKGRTTPGIYPPPSMTINVVKEEKKDGGEELGEFGSKKLIGSKEAALARLRMNKSDELDSNDDDREIAGILLLLSEKPVIFPSKSGLKFDDQGTKREFVCKKCGKVFSTQQALGGRIAGHRNKKRTEEVGPPSQKKHKCSMCGKEFSTGPQLGGHMGAHNDKLSAVAAAQSMLNSHIGSHCPVVEPPPPSAIAEEEVVCSENSWAVDFDLNKEQQLFS